MPLRTPTNQITEKDIHTRVELWEDVICFVPYFFSNSGKNPYPDGSPWKKDHELTYAPIPSRFGEIKKELISELEKQEKDARDILAKRPKKRKGDFWWIDYPVWRKLVSWLNQIHPTNTGSQEIDPVLRDLNSLRTSFEYGSIEEQIRFLGNILDKNYSLPQIEKVKTWHKELRDLHEKDRPNNNFCFIKKDTINKLQFVFLPSQGYMSEIYNYLFYRNGIFYEVSNVERVNYTSLNVIVDCVWSKFVNDYYNFYSGGFSGITHNSPYLTVRYEKCGCPDFSSSNRISQFNSDWQPSYSLWYLHSPYSRETHSFEIMSGGKKAGTIFSYYDLKPLVGKASPGWIKDTTYFLLPKDYKETDNRVYRKEINGITFKGLENWLRNGIKLKIGGNEETINLYENPHLLEHINVKLLYSGKEIKTCRFSDFKGDKSIFSKPTVYIHANLTGINYQLETLLLSVQWQEKTSFVLEAGKFFSWMMNMGSSLSSLIPVWGNSLSKATSATLDTMKSFNANLDSKTTDSKGGFEERETERRNEVASVNNSPFVEDNEPGKKEKEASMALNGTPLKNFAERQHARKYTSWRFAPGKAVSSALGSIPPMLASSTLKNDYSLYDFVLRKFNSPLKIQLSYNLDLFEHYINAKRVGKNEGLLLINEKQFINKINKAGFYRFTPHLIEKDIDNFFTSKFSSGIHLYKHNPKEIWDVKMGVGSATNLKISRGLISGIATTANEKTDRIEATDHYSHLDGRSWLTHNSVFHEEGKSKNNRIIELINSRPTTGAPALTNPNFICDWCKDNNDNDITTCWHHLWPQDHINCNKDGSGDHMSARYGDESLIDDPTGESWITKNTEYFRKDEVSWGDQYETIDLPRKRGKTLDWGGFRGGGCDFATRSEVEDFIENVLKKREDCFPEGKWVDEFNPLKETWNKTMKYLGSVGAMIDVKSDWKWDIESSEVNADYGEDGGVLEGGDVLDWIYKSGTKVDKYEYEAKRHDPDYVVYAKPVGGGEFTGTSTQEVINWTKDEKGKPVKKTSTASVNNYSKTQYEYYIKEKATTKRYYVKFKWRKKN